MPVNSRYLGDTYSSSSSLYKKAQAAQKKQQALEDTEMKYLWDTNQIDNNAYFDYASTRFNETTDEADKISWDRTVRSVKKEIISDWKNNALYEISSTPGNTSNDAYNKVQMYKYVAEQCQANGDEDGALQAMTAMNNAQETYMNKLESEYNAGVKSAKTKLNNEVNAATRDSEIMLKDIENPLSGLYQNNKSMSAMVKANANLNIAQAYYYKYANEVDEEKQSENLEKFLSARNAAYKELQPFMTQEMYDQVDSLFSGDLVAGQLGKVDVKTQVVYDSFGRPYPVPTKGYHYEVGENGELTLSDKDTTGMVETNSGGLTYYSKVIGAGSTLTKFGDKYYNSETGATTDYKPEMQEGGFYKDLNGNLRQANLENGQVVGGDYVDIGDFYQDIKASVNNVRLKWYKQNGILGENATLDDVYTVPAENRLNFDWNARKFVLPQNQAYATAKLPEESKNDDVLSAINGLRGNEVQNSMDKINNDIWKEAGGYARLLKGVEDVTGQKITDRNAFVAAGKVISAAFKEGLKTEGKAIKQVAKSASTALGIKQAAAPVKSVISQLPKESVNVVKQAVAPIKQAVGNYVDTAKMAFKAPEPIKIETAAGQYGELVGKTATGQAFFKKALEGMPDVYQYYTTQSGTGQYTKAKRADVYKAIGKV